MEIAASSSDGQEDKKEDKKEVQFDIPAEPEPPEDLEIAGVMINEESSLKVLRNACKYLRVSANGTKDMLLKRLRTEVATAKLKVACEAAEHVIADYAREPESQKVPEKPDAAEVAKHELTHMPQQDWCGACAQARSKEAVHETVEPAETQVVSLDWMLMFTGLGDAPLAVHLLAVDHATRYVVVIPVENKSATSQGEVVEELLRM